MDHLSLGRRQQMSSEAKLQEINGTKRNFAMDLQVLHLTGVCDFKTNKTPNEIPNIKNDCCPLFVYYIVSTLCAGPGTRT